MLLNLKRVFLNEGACEHIRHSLNFAEIEIDGVFPFKSPIQASVTAENLAGAVELTCKVELDYEKPCDRCTADTTKHLSMMFKHKLVVSLSGSENDDYIEAPHYTLNLDELLTADVLLELPIRHLCKEDCKGLCQKCGKDLNEEECSCDKSQIDPRFEVLKQLIDSEQ